MVCETGFHKPSFLIAKKMKYTLILIGVILVAIAVLYFIQLTNLIGDSYEFSNYGLGILAGNSILLLIGVLLMFLGIKKLRTRKA